MLNTKLIFVDGISGSGKSTTAHYIARQLEKNGIKAKWIIENENDHPLRFKSTSNDDNDYIEEYKSLYHEQWTDFAEKVFNDDQIYIIDAYLFQDVIIPFLLHDRSRSEIDEFYSRMTAMIAKLNPVIIHFYQQSTAETIRNIWNARGGISQKNFYLNKHGKNKFCTSRNISGEQAVFTFWDEVVKISKELYANFEFKKIQIDNSAKDWSKYRKQITDFLEIDQIIEENPFDESFAKYCGLYGELEIYQKDSRLYAYLRWPDLKLLHCAEDEFLIESFPFRIKFLKEENNEIKSVKFIKGFGPAKDGDIWSKLNTIELNEKEQQLLCGNYRYESEKLDREIYLKDNELYYLRTDGSESKLIPTSPTKLVMQGGSAILTFDIVNGIKQFILASPNQKDLIFIQTNS